MDEQIDWQHAVDRQFGTLVYKNQSNKFIRIDHELIDFSTDFRLFRYLSIASWFGNTPKSLILCDFGVNDAIVFGRMIADSLDD